MEMTPMTSARRLDGVRAYGRAADAFETVAWRAPEPRRFDPRVANDVAEPKPTLKQLAADLPAWVPIVGGGVVAAFMGAMLGGMLSL
jgi:hypothetical protein